MSCVSVPGAWCSPHFGSTTHLGPAGKRAALPSLGHTGNQKPGDLMGALKITHSVCLWALCSSRCPLRGDAPGIPAHSLFCLGAGTSMWTHTPGDDPVAYCGAWCHSRHPGAPKTSRWGKETSPRDCLSLASSFCSRRASMMAPGTCIQAMGLFTQKAPEID